MTLATKPKPQETDEENVPMIETEWGDVIPVSEYAEAQRRYEAGSESD